MRSVLACLVLLISSLAAAQGPSNVSDDQTKLLALENAWNRAQMHHDAAVLDEMVPSTFVYTDYDGTVMNKAQFLADLEDPDYRATLVANEDVRVYPYPNMAIVVGTYHTKGTYKGKPFEHYGRFTDTWIYASGKWQCAASHTNLIKK
jgi:hypothetical protein